MSWVAPKVKCAHCTKKFLPRKLVEHNKYFCGPNARRTLKQSKTEKTRKMQETKKKAMKTLRIGAGDADDDDDDDDDEEEEEGGGEGAGSRKKQKKKAPAKKKAYSCTPSGIYRELMDEANREAVPMYAPGVKGGAAGGAGGAGGSGGGRMGASFLEELEGDTGGSAGGGGSSSAASAAAAKKRKIAKKKEEEEEEKQKKQKIMKKKKKKKKKKDPNAPKKALSAYLYFGQTARAKIKEEMPELKGKEVMPEIGKRWKALDEEVRHITITYT